MTERKQYNIRAMKPGEVLRAFLDELSQDLIVWGQCRRGVSGGGAPRGGTMTDAEIHALLARAQPRDRVILAARPDDPERLDHIEREDVMVIPKEDWLQICIWLAASRGAPTPAMLKLRAAAQQVADESSPSMAPSNGAIDRLRAALTAPEGVIATHPDGRLKTMHEVLGDGGLTGLTMERLRDLLYNFNVGGHPRLRSLTLAECEALAAYLVPRLAAPQT